MTSRASGRHILVLLTLVGCNTAPQVGRPSGSDAGPQQLRLSPSEVTLGLVFGQPAPMATFSAAFAGATASRDVTAASHFDLDDLTVGLMNGSTFTASGVHGGTVHVTATYHDDATGVDASGSATIHLKVSARITGSDCPGCPAFPTDTAPACPAGAPATLVYPADGVLVPPNLNQFEVHFSRGSAAATYEVAFQNSSTDVRITTLCPTVEDSRALVVAGGCALAIDPQWTLIAGSNRGGEPLTLTVRASTDGTCASISSNAVRMYVAQEDTVGAIYYWKSKFTPIGSGGDIWRKSFGSALPEERITPDTLLGNRTDFPCWGCHTLSRDGARMTVNADDSDSDDEYGDVSAGLFDLGSKRFLTDIGYGVGWRAGFQTFSNDHSLVLSSDGDGSGLRNAGRNGGGGGPSNLFWLWQGTDGGVASPDHVTVGPPAARPTMPDWSLDNRTVVFVMPTITGWINPGGGRAHLDDAHVFGGSIWTLAYDHGFGVPTELVPSSGDNNYYPSISPAGGLVVFDHVDRQATDGGALDGCTPKSGSFAGSCPNDSFSNPKARLRLSSLLSGDAPIDLALANGSPGDAPKDVSNSWPRWSPFVQTYQGHQLLWVTFSSTRDYGLRVRNHVPVGGLAQQQCYPADSAQDPGGQHGGAIADDCKQPQLWMAAIDIGGGEQPGVGDPSHQAFWLPYQDMATHNHTAQWTATIVTGGACAKSGESCKAQPCCANEGVCLANGSCGVP